MLLAVGISLGSDPDKESAILGGLFLGFIFGLPGALLRWRIRRADAARNLELRLQVFLKTRERFGLDELASHLKRPTEDVELLLARLMVDDRLQLAYHRSAGVYVQKQLLQTPYRVLNRCQACGASLAHELVLDGEALACRYCGAAL
jgi:hypothetical protein